MFQSFLIYKDPRLKISPGTKTKKKRACPERWEKANAKRQAQTGIHLAAGYAGCGCARSVGSAGHCQLQPQEHARCKRREGATVTLLRLLPRDVHDFDVGMLALAFPSTHVQLATSNALLYVSDLQRWWVPAGSNSPVPSILVLDRPPSLPTRLPNLPEFFGQPVNPACRPATTPPCRRHCGPTHDKSVLSPIDLLTTYKVATLGETQSKW